MTTHYEVSRRIASYIAQHRDVHSRDAEAPLSPIKPLKPIRSLRGSRMQVQGADPVLQYHMLQNSGGTFTPVAVGISYSTYVVMVVHNSHSPTPSTPFELWVNPNQYSVTTQRHVGMYISAFLSAMGYPDEAPVYRTEAVPLAQTGQCIDRTAPILHTNVLDSVLSTLHLIDKPYLHEGTRRAHVTNAAAHLRIAIRHMTHAYPPGADPNADRSMHRAAVVRELRSLLDDLIEPMDATVPIDQIRLQIRAYLSLTKE